MSRPRLLAAHGLVALLLAGCGAPSPGEAVPSLTEGVARVDEAVVAGDRDAARAALEGLVDDAERAVAAGDLDPEQADAVVAAAEALLAEVDAPTPRQEEPEESLPSGSTTTPPSDEPDEEEPDEKEPDEEEPDEGGLLVPPGKPEKPEKPGQGPPDERD